ncbi:ephrin type-B receptor 1-B-like [Dendronephthya gigantea]|uniref:ephrin type-B receptor 1-B-like n=1 Tax=Dendronephthya gigantea TaxID=151771 RepID=UPI00106900D8|nr:ephrin type-B receptor 1-B-like [Dendronephthya gigantea]
MGRMRVSHREDRRVKMACSFTSWRIMASLLVLSTLCCACFAEKEYLIKGKLWDNESTSDQTGGRRSVWTRQDDGSALFCGRKTNAKFPLKYIKTKDAKKVFVEIEYNIYRTFGESSGLFILSNLLMSENISEAKDKEGLVEKHSVDKIASNVRKKATLHYDINEDDHFMNLTLLGFKVCVKVFSITVYYNVCPANESLKVTRTAAPRIGFIEASVNCSIKQSGKKGSVVVAKCGSDGNWSKVEDKEGGCTNDCDPGTELINDTCTACEENHFKQNRGTYTCKKCPPNTVSEESRTRCKCKIRYYRNTDNGPCKTIPSKPKHLSYILLSSHAIQLNWNVSQQDASSNPGLYFHVKCKQHGTHNQRVPCRNLSLGERGVNVSKSPFMIQHLLNDTTYTFIVVAMNDVSGHVSEEEWMHATVDVRLQGSITTKATKVSTKHTTEKPPVVTTSGWSSSSSGSSRGLPETESKTSSNAVPSVFTTAFSKGSVQARADKDDDEQFMPYIGIASGFIILIIIVLLIIHCKRKHMKKKKLDIEEEGMLLNYPETYVNPAKYGNPEKAVRKFAKEIDRREIKLEGLIGEGEFAKVHKGMLCRPNEPPVAVALKILKPGSTPKNREDFLTEAAVMGQFKDMNIVALEGVVTQSHPVVIITEFMHNGALSDYLVRHKNRFTEIELLGMARGIASGMKYLARMRYVHRDLAARNVLVNENLVCKVADFGLTRELEESCQGEYVTQGGKIAIRWTAPEAYKHRRFTTASDVWSYGIVLWEIMTYADRPYGDWDNYMVMHQVTANYRLFPPMNCPKIVHQLMMECWNADRSQRPSFTDIVEMLERWIRNPYLLKDYQYVTEKDRMADRKSCIAKSIREYLEGIKMDRYIENFIDFGYTELYQIQNMTDDDLVNIGVPLVGHRNKIIKGLRGESEPLLPIDAVDV